MGVGLLFDIRIQFTDTTHALYLIEMRKWAKLHDNKRCDAKWNETKCFRSTYTTKCNNQFLFWTPVPGIKYLYSTVTFERWKMNEMDTFLKKSADISSALRRQMAIGWIHVHTHTHTYHIYIHIYIYIYIYIHKIASVDKINCRTASYRRLIFIDQHTLRVGGKERLHHPTTDCIHYFTRVLVSLAIR